MGVEPAQFGVTHESHDPHAWGRGRDGGNLVEARLAPTAQDVLDPSIGEARSRESLDASELVLARPDIADGQQKQRAQAAHWRWMTVDEVRAHRVVDHG